MSGAPTGLPELRTHEGDLLACVHCGFCLPACPTYRVLGDENDSPRGRLYLMRALAEGRVEPEPAIRRHLDRCLGCRACEPVCPAEVRYGFLLERTREALVERAEGAEGEREDPLLLWLLTGGVSRPLYALARAARRIGISDLAARLPGRLGRAAGMLAATRPIGFEGVAAQGGDAPRESAAGPSWVLLEGCVMGGLFGHVHAATRVALRARGWAERTAPGQGCCGALHAHAGRMDRAREMARRNVAAFEASGAARIVVDSAGCGAALREYGEWLRDDPEWADRAAAVAGRVRDVSEALDPGPGAEGNGRRAAGEEGGAETDLPWDRARRRLRVAYDAPCHLCHAQGVREAPLRMLRAVRGLEVEPLPSAERCCGSAGSYALRRPALADRVREPKLQEIREGGYDAVASGNPGCLMYLGEGLRRAGIAVPVVHPVELVAAAVSEGKER